MGKIIDQKNIEEVLKDTDRLHDLYKDEIMDIVVTYKLYMKLNPEADVLFAMAGAAFQLGYMAKEKEEKGDKWQK